MADVFEYEYRYIGSDGYVDACRRCGSFVFDREAHDKLHALMSALLESLELIVG